MDKYYWVIETIDNKRSSSYKYITDTLEDAQAHRMDFCGWYCERGDCTIKKIDSNFNVLEHLDYWHGKLWEHVDRTGSEWKLLVKNGRKLKKPTTNWH